MKKLGISYNVGTLEKSVLLGAVKILRKVLSIKKRLENSNGGGGGGPGKEEKNLKKKG